MSKYKKAKIQLENKALYKEKKPIYATRKLSIGLVSCMLGLTLIAPNAFAQEELVENNEAQEYDQGQANEDTKDVEDKNKEASELDKVRVPEVKIDENNPNNEGNLKDQAIDKTQSESELEDEILTEDEIKAIKEKAEKEYSYVFGSYRLEQLKNTLVLLKKNNPDFYKENKQIVINNFIKMSVPKRGEVKDANELEIGPKIGGPAVTAAVKAPTVNDVLYDATTISGDNIAKARINKKTVIATVHVTLKGKDGTVKATLSDTPKSGTKWSVTLPDGKKVEEGDTVTVYQQIGEDKSPEVTKDAQASKASSVTLTMPTGEVWVEEYTANVLNDDEKAEAIDLLKKANPTIAKDIKSVEFKVTGIEPNKVASYIVTYTDNSKTEEIKAPGLTIKPVTETSRSPEIGSITVVDNVVKGKLAGPGPFDGIKVQLIISVKKEKSGDFCTDKGCKFDKDSSKPVEVALEKDGTFSYTLQQGESLTLDQIVGVSVKEPHKFVSCSTTTVKPVPVEKKEVRDPRKLTAEDKKAIDAAIRKAYTVGGESKLPNGTGDWDGVPAVIQFDDSGNVKIFSGNDVAGTWDSNYKFVPEKNEDGSVKVNDGAEPVITIPAKDLLKNLKPDAPTLALSEDKKNITITPNLKVDTDAKIINVSYKDKDGKDKTTTATKADDGTWSVVGEGTVANGVITLPRDKVKGGTDVTATVTDKGGIADKDTDPLTSDPGTLPVKETKAEKVEDLGGLDPVAIKKWVGDDVDWKDGVKAKDSATEENKGKINELLKGAKFEDVTEEKRNTTQEGDFTGKVKVTFDDDSEIIVEKQMLYVSNHVTSMERKDKVPTDALDVEFKLGEGTKVDNTDGTSIDGNKDNPTSYSKYKVKPNTNLKDYKLPAIKSSVVDSIKLKEQDGYTDPVWNSQDSASPTNFVASSTNKVFTATATKTYDITFDANTGCGKKDKVTQKVNTEYELPAANTFTAPDENHEFSGWQIGDDSTNLKQPGAKITITGDTIVKAIWKPIELKVKFQTEAGASGTMEDKTVNKGSKYELPKPTFKPEEGKEFAGWKVGDGTELNKVGTKIDISGDVTLTATWKDIEYKVTFNGNKGSGTMPGATVKKGEKYKLPENTFGAPSDKQEFKTWEVDGKEVAAGTEITIEKDTEVKAIWKDKTSEPSAKDKVKVSFDGNGAKGGMKEETLEKGKTYKLPENGFEVPEGKEFDGWEIGGVGRKPGDEITVTDNVKVVAKWKDKTSEPSVKDKVKVSFDGNGAKGGMKEETLDKGNTYKLPENGFEVPEDKEFDHWEIGGVSYKPGDEIKVSGNVEVKAIWKAKKPGKPGDNPSKPVEPGKPGENPSKPGDKPGKPGEKPAKPGSEKPGKDGEKIPVPKVTERKEQAENKAKNANPNVKTGVESLSLVTASLVSAASALFMTFKKKKND